MTYEGSVQLLRETTTLNKIISVNDATATPSRLDRAVWLIDVDE